MAKMSAMDALEELLPGIEEFLVKALSRERLATSTEKKRLFFIERLEVIKMPPSLPPLRGNRPTGLPKQDEEGPDLESGIRDSYLAMQRTLSRFCANNQNSPTQPNQVDDGQPYYDVSDNIPPSHPPPPPPCTNRIPVTFITSNGNGVHALDDEEDDLYEEPVGLENFGIPSDQSDYTSFESYDDEDVVYENQKFPDNKESSPAIARKAKEERVKTKKKKKSSSRNGSQEVIAKKLPNVIYCGEIAQKGKLYWNNRYAAVQDPKLLVFKSEKEANPLLNVTLTGYDAMYTVKDGKRHVVRLSQPGHETYWFSVDTKEKAERWVEVLTSSSQSGSGGSVQRSESSLPDTDLSRISSENVSADQSSVTNPSLSGSEGGSGDGTVGSLPISPKHSVDDMEKKLPLSKQKAGKAGVMDSLSSFFGTVGRKKGKTVNKAMVDPLFEKFEGDSDALIYGLLIARSDKTNKKWLQRWCSVKNGQLEVFSDSGEDTPEMSVTLAGCEIQNARVNKRQLAIRLVKDGKEIITLDTADTNEQGKWLGFLIKESGCGGNRSGSGSMDYTYVDEDDGTDVPTAESEDIYHEVYEDRVTAVQILIGGSSGSGSGSSTSGSAGARVIDKKSITRVMDNVPPPPLPTTAPPIHRVRGRKVGDDDSVYDNVNSYSDDEVFEEGFDVQYPSESLVESDSQIYENSGIHIGSTEDEDGLVYENADIMCDNNNTKDIDDSNISNDDSMRKVNDKNLRNKNHVQFGLKLPGLKKVKSAVGKSPAAKSMALTTNENVIASKRSPVPTPRSVQQRILMLEGATVGETDDTPAEPDDVYEDTETVFQPSLSKESERKDIKIAVNAASKKEEEVVKSHSGPTIHVDKDILDQTENPILSELRKQRKDRGNLRQSELEDIREKLSQTKRNLAQFKKKRAEIRSQKLCSIDVDEKLRLGRELRQMDREQDKLEAEVSRYQDKENEILKEERAALRSSLRGTSCTTSSATSRYSPKTTPVGSPKSTRTSTTSTGSLSSLSSWKHVDSPSKDKSSAGVRGYTGSSSPITGSKFGGVGSAARGPFASRYTDSFSKLGSNESSPTASPTHSYTSKVTTVKTITNGSGGKSSTMTSYTAQRTQKLGLGPRSATMPSRLEMRGSAAETEEERPASPRGGREKVKETLKLWESRTNTTSDC